MVKKVPTPANICHHACNCVTGASMPDVFVRTSLNGTIADRILYIRALTKEHSKNM